MKYKLKYKGWPIGEVANFDLKTGTGVWQGSLLVGETDHRLDYYQNDPDWEVEPLYESSSLSTEDGLKDLAELDAPLIDSEDFNRNLFGSDHSWIIDRIFPVVKANTEGKVKSDGGATSYYDFPFKDWTTTNDMMEYLAEHKWGKYGIHLKDIFKGLCRWGDKDGTTVEYDTKKVVYYGVRVLKMIVGVDKTREYLYSLLNDKQFESTDKKEGK